MGNIISNTTAQTTALDLSDGNLTVKNQFSASGPSTFNGTGTFNKPVILNDISTFNATGVFNKPVTFGDSVSISNNMINGVNLASTATDVSTLRTTVTNLIGPTGTIDTSLVKTSKLDINGDIVNTGTGAAYITASTGAGLVLKDGLTSGGANIKIYNGYVIVNGTAVNVYAPLTLDGFPLNTKGGEINTSGGKINGGDITGSSFNTLGSIKGASLSIGTMVGGTTIGSMTLAGGSITAGAITGTSLDAGSGTIKTTGQLSGGSLNVSGPMTGTSLTTTNGGNINAGTGAISGGSLNVGTGGMTGGFLNAGTGNIKGGSLNLTGSGSTLTAQQDIISTNGWLYAKGISLTGAGGMTGGFLNVGSGGMTGGFLNVGSGGMTGGFLNVGAGAITGGAITGTSLNLTGAGTITGSSLNVGTGTLTGGEIKIGSKTNWSIKEDTNGRLCFHKGTNNAGFACIDTTGNLVPF